ncbi:MAG: hypothetical protein KatS3mg019_0767 [Fimbriimonadales bacterium]|nr:MAG: hypothetical protein KatS3mg019_0767 [Fimbriimonadales bacterium]
MRTEIPTPVVIGIIVVIIAILGFFVVRSLFEPAPTVDTIRAGGPTTAPPTNYAPAPPQGANPAPYQPPAGYGAPRR